MEIDPEIFTIVVSILCVVIYYLNSIFAIRHTTELQSGKHYLLVTAHPDDECMFFSPTIVGLTSAGNRVSVVCLSSGDADGLGRVREKELESSCSILGCKPEDIECRQHEKLPDSMTTSWQSSIIAREISLFIRTKKESYDAFITFDEYGVSSHPNHTSILPGLIAYTSSLPKTQTRPDIWKLRTTSLIRKYAGVLDAMPSLTMVTYRVATAPGKRAKKRGHVMAFMSDPRQSWRGQKAMVIGHRSQMRWFRWFWVVIGRYMYINDLSKVTA